MFDSAIGAYGRVGLKANGSPYRTWYCRPKAPDGFTS
jgi:hypothetical protein